MKNFNLNMVIKKNIIDIRDIIVTTFNEWLDDKAFKMAAALSFYSIISLVPVIVIVTGVAGLIFGQKAATGQLITAVSDYVGLPTAELIQSIILNAYVPESGIIPIVIGLIFFIWTSLTVFVEIRSSLNSIWGIEVKPGKGIKEFFRGRFFSLLVLVIIGLVFILSLISGILLNFVDDVLTNSSIRLKFVLDWIETLFSFVTVTILFTITYKYLPSVRTRWRYVFIGAIITAVLFKLGIFIIDIYLSQANYSSVYGATGSLVVLLLWIYYCSLIFFFGAELIQVIRRRMLDEPLTLSENVLEIVKVTEQMRNADSGKPLMSRE